MERIQRLLSNIWWGIIFTACMWGMRSHAVTTTAKTTPTQNQQPPYRPLVFKPRDI